MLKKVKIFVLLLVFVPTIIFADKVSFNKGVQNANSYINEPVFSSRIKYLLLNGNNRFIMNNNGTMSFDSRFVHGGLLNYREFCLTTNNNECKGISYLVIPTSYWTCSGSSTNKYYINNIKGIDSKSDNNIFGVRVTEFVRPQTEVKGLGTYSNPWYFVGNSFVSLSTNSKTYATFNETGTNKFEKYVGTSCIKGSGYCVNFDMTIHHGYENNVNDGCNFNLISKNGLIHKYEISNITSDIECFALFVKKVFTIKFDCNGGTGLIEDKTVRYDDNLVLYGGLCSKTGYTQDGWTNGVNEKWNLGSSVKFSFDDGEKGINNKSLVLKASWAPNTFTVKYNGNGATGGSVSSHTCTYDEACTLASNGFGRKGYTFGGWKKENSGNNLTAGSSIKNTVTGGTVTYYAQWIPCTAGTFNAGTTEGCSACLSDQWSNDMADKCFPKCSEVKYVETSQCSKTCGGGTKRREAYSAYDNNYRCASSDDWSGSACNTHSCDCTVYCTTPDNCSKYGKPTNGNKVYAVFTCNASTGKTGPMQECRYHHGSKGEENAYWFGDFGCDHGPGEKDDWSWLCTSGQLVHCYNWGGLKSTCYSKAPHCGYHQGLKLKKSGGYACSCD